MNIAAAGRMTAALLFIENLRSKTMKVRKHHEFQIRTQQL